MRDYFGEEICRESQDITDTPESRPLTSPPRVQELKAAIRQTKAARYLRKMRSRNAPLPRAPQLTPKMVGLPGDYARPKRMTAKSKLGECATVESLNLSTESKKRMGNTLLGPKGRAHAWAQRSVEAKVLVEGRFWKVLA